MSNYALMIRWGSPFPGREQKSLEVFMAATEYFATLKAKGQIAEHRTYLSTTGDLDSFGGFMSVEGSLEQLRNVIDADAFSELTLKARHLVSHIEHVHCLTGAEVGNEVQRIVKVRKELGL